MRRWIVPLLLALLVIVDGVHRSLLTRRVYLLTAQVELLYGALQQAQVEDAPFEPDGVIEGEI